jgi:single-strand DNA-binding protein
MNKATILGYVERAPELRSTFSGQPVASFSVATNRHWTTNAGEERESTEWFNVVAWGDLAEAASQTLQEHQRLFAEGHLQTRGWKDAEGQRCFLTELVATKLIPLDLKEEPEQAPAISCESMPHCLNQIVVIGNLGRDPEMRYTPGGQAVTSFSLATTRTWIASDGVRKDSTEWFNIVAWGSLAEICNQHLSKGRRVYIEGELRTRGWEQADGKKHFRTELVANEMIILGPRPVQTETHSHFETNGNSLPF